MSAGRVNPPRDYDFWSKLVHISAGRVNFPKSSTT
jgi:hypothetical protein